MNKALYFENHLSSSAIHTKKKKKINRLHRNTEISLITSISQRGRGKNLPFFFSKSIPLKTGTAIRIKRSVSPSRHGNTLEYGELKACITYTRQIRIGRALHGNTRAEWKDQPLKRGRARGVGVHLELITCSPRTNYIDKPR